MPDIHFEFLVEERSMEGFLQVWLPVFLPKCTFKVSPFQGKRALLKELGNRLAAYAKWLPENYRLVVMVDRDGKDCRELKNRLEGICRKAGLTSKKSAQGGDWQVATVIAVEELEAWYFGDWEAVRQAYPKAPEDVPRRAAYRDPDAIGGGTWEAFERVMQKSGCLKGGLPKVDAARRIGVHMDPRRGNKSASFNFFHRTLADPV
ncbi:MAG: DUF4276 family protein [Hyphomonadaceae bacterium]|nr:DUF4276 family protein [Hyphomonadaceae bacterium]MBC6412559.1 DUF4276 family protein [Hyphomonadaceae bacterium]